MEKVTREVFDVLKLLTPFDIDLQKVQYGNRRDGCYILVDLPQSGDVMSFGISHDVGFEMDMARQNRRIFLFDHTIPELPSAHTNFNFQKKGICPSGVSNHELATLEEHINAVGGVREGSILKMDVEGHEWGVFSTSSDATLRNFDQIVVELHWLDNLRDPTFRETVQLALANLNSQFSLFHVHANNCRELSIVEGFMVADVIEVSYIRTNLVRRFPSRTVYPTSLNKGNYPGRHDYPLLFFPFLPMSVDAAQVNDVVTRLNLESAIED